MGLKMMVSAALVLAGIAAPSFAAEAVPVTVDNFVRAESDLYFNNVVQQVGVGTFHHSRETMPIDRQTVTFHRVRVTQEQAVVYAESILVAHGPRGYLT